MLSGYLLFSTTDLIYFPISSKCRCCSSRPTHSLTPVLQLLYQTACKTCQIPADPKYAVKWETDRKEEENSGKNREAKHFSLVPEEIFLWLLDMYSLYYHLLSKSIGGNFFWQRDFQTDSRKSARKTCSLSHHMRLSGVSCNDFFLCCLNLLTNMQSSSLNSFPWVLSTIL